VPSDVQVSALLYVASEQAISTRATHRSGFATPRFRSCSATTHPTTPSACCGLTPQSGPTAVACAHCFPATNVTTLLAREVLPQPVSRPHIRGAASTGAALFLNTYGPAVLDLLPGDIWDRLFIVCSAPRGGKTSLMKLFEAETLRTLHDRRDKFADLAERLSAVGALGEDGPTLIGARIDLRRNYKALLDLAGPPQLAERLFLRLINARVTIGVLDAALTLAGRTFPGDVGLIRLEVPTEAEDSLERLGGSSGQSLFDRAHEAESAILDLVDSLMPVGAEALTGHADLYALRALQNARIAVDSHALAGRPLVMFDDGQDLDPTQRRYRRCSIAVQWSESSW
jgi:hypothetical protein